MEFNDQVKLSSDEPKFVPPSKWHIFYWLKWQFVVKPKLIKALNKAKAEMVDEILNSDILKARIK